MKVSWQVTGIRKDRWAQKNRMQVEERKSGKERGHHLDPELYGQPKEKGIHVPAQAGKRGTRISRLPDITELMKRAQRAKKPGRGGESRQSGSPAKFAGSAERPKKT
jgi:hypothetical protein